MHKKNAQLFAEYMIDITLDFFSAVYNFDGLSACLGYKKSELATRVIPCDIMSNSGGKTYVCYRPYHFLIH